MFRPIMTFFTVEIFCFVSIIPFKIMFVYFGYLSIYSEETAYAKSWVVKNPNLYSLENHRKQPFYRY